MTERIESLSAERGLADSAEAREEMERAVAAAAKLRERLGTDGEAHALLAVLTAALGQTILLYIESESRHGANVRGAGSFLSGLTANLGQYRKTLGESDALLAQLSDRVFSTLAHASWDISRARGAAREVLEMQARYRGDAEELKRGVWGLAVAVLSAYYPGFGSVAAGKP